MQYKKSQAKETSLEPSTNQLQVKQIIDRIQAQLPNALNTINQIITTINLLITDKDYGKSNRAILSVFKNKYLRLQQALESSKALNVTGQLVQIPPTPSADFENASTLFSRLNMLQMQATNQLSTLLRSMNTGIDLINQALNTKEPWATNLSPMKANWQIAQKTAWELHLITTKYANLNRKAYPSMTPLSKPKKHNLDIWNKTAHKIRAFQRVYGQQYTFPEVLYHFTKQWDMFERFNFKKWYKWSFMKKANLTEKIQKYATSDSIGEDRLNKFTEKRKKLMNRINLVRKALHEMINSGLISSQDSSKLYRIISMLEHDAMNLQAPKLASARTMRASKQMDKLGFIEGAQILQTAAQELLEKSLVKTADTNGKEIVDILRAIKAEMDSFNYSKHLDTLYDIKKRLENIGRSADTEAVEKIIRDDLGTLEKLNKKLIEVYTNLSKVPLELSILTDQVMQPTSSPKEVEVPLEVKEEQLEEEVAPKVENVKKPQPEGKKLSTPLTHLEKRKTREQTPAPTLERAIPNV